MTDLFAHVVRLANSPQAPRCQGWDAEDPAGCWTHDMRKSTPIDYCDGFRLFAEVDAAEEYGAGLGGTFTLGFDTVVQRWAVTPLGIGTYGS